MSVINAPHPGAEAYVALLKQKFGYKTFRTVLALLGVQIFSITIYILTALLLFILLAGQDGTVPRFAEFIPLVVAQAVAAVRSYGESRKLGEEQMFSFYSGRARPDNYGITLGLYAISPIIACWAVTLVRWLFTGRTSIFAEILGYLLFSWSAYFDLMAQIVDIESFWSNLIYIPTLVPICLTCYFGFKRGVEGQREINGPGGFRQGGRRYNS